MPFGFFSFLFFTRSNHANDGQAPPHPCLSTWACPHRSVRGCSCCFLVVGSTPHALTPVRSETADGPDERRLQRGLRRKPLSRLAHGPVHAAADPARARGAFRGPRADGLSGGNSGDTTRSLAVGIAVIGRKNISQNGDPGSTSRLQW